MMRAKFLFVALCLFAGVRLSAQDLPPKPAKVKAKAAHEKEAVAPQIADFGELHHNMDRLRDSMERLRDDLAPLADMDFPETPPLPEIDFVMPEIAELRIPEIEIPEIPPLAAFDFEMPEIPEIHIPPIPALAFSDFSFSDGDCYPGRGASRLFEDMTDDEKIRLEALRVIGQQEDEKALAMLQKVLKEEKSPALRYEAARQLAQFIDHESVVPLLGEAAKNDKNVEVRKKAISVLGKSGDPRAVALLRELLH